MKHLALAAALLAFCGCSRTAKVYRDTWEPLRIETESLPRLVTEALRVRDNDLTLLQAAGAELIGYHTVRKGWPVRAGSTGGTHFVPVESTAGGSQTNCFAWGNTATCVSNQRPGRWTRVAVFRLSPMRWHLLPPHMIPPSNITVPGTAASALRDGCNEPDGFGDVRCGSDWTVRTGKQAPAWQQGEGK